VVNTKDRGGKLKKQWGGGDRRKKGIRDRPADQRAINGNTGPRDQKLLELAEDAGPGTSGTRLQRGKYKVKTEKKKTNIVPWKTVCRGGIGKKKMRY